MGSVVDSLKRLYKKIGGGKVKGPIAIDDLVDKIADQMSSGGSGSGESKEVVTVIVTIDFDDFDSEEESIPLAISHSYEQLSSAWESGKKIDGILRSVGYNDGVSLLLSDVGIEDTIDGKNLYHFTFSSPIKIANNTQSALRTYRYNFDYNVNGAIVYPSYFSLLLE